MNSATDAKGVNVRQSSDKTGMGVASGHGRAATLSDVRRSNEALILGELRLRAGSSNAEISRQTGLAPQTVSVIVADLAERGLILSGEPLRGKRGQPATPKFLNSDAAYAVGFEIGWRHLDAVLVDVGGTLIAHHHQKHDYPDPDTICDQLETIYETLVAKFNEQSRTRIVGIGIAMPSNIWVNLFRMSPPAGTAERWQDLDLSAEIANRTGQTVSILNDGTAACQAEYAFGAGQNFANMASFYISTFICSGLVVAHRLFDGPTGNSANMGSILVTTRGKEPQFLHLIAGLEALDEKFAAVGRNRISTRDDIEAWQDPLVADWLDEAAEGLAFAVANSGAVIEFEQAVIGGRIPDAIRQDLVERMRTHLASLPPTTFAPPLILEGQMGQQAPAMGAASVPLFEKFFAHQLQRV